MAPGTKFASDLSAGISPLQLGVMLVFISIALFIPTYGQNNHRRGYVIEYGHYLSLRYYKRCVFC